MQHLKTLVPWATQKNITQPLINKAKGCYFYDQSKNKILDFTSGLMVVNLGHNNKRIYKSFKDHANTGIAYLPGTFQTYQREKLSESLIDLSKMEKGKVFYTCGGAESNETAIFISQEVSDSKKTRVLSFKKSYHGGSSVISSLISGDDRRYNKGKHYDSKNINMEPILNNPELCDSGKSSLIQIENEFKKGDVCSILVEGSSGSAGIHLYPDKYLKNVRKLCDNYGVVLICDEVMSGFGRTGTLFAHQKKEQNILPDIITCAKGLTSGYVPLGAVIVSNNVSNYFDENVLNQGLTYFGHTFACRVANECIKQYKENDMRIIKEVNEKGDIMNTIGKILCSENNLIQDYRSNGLLGGFELNLGDKKMNKVKKELYNKNIYCYIRNNYIFTAPPLIIDSKTIENTMNVISNTISEVSYLKK